VIVLITDHLFKAFIECPTKCYLWAHGENCSGNPNAEWARNRHESYCNEELKRLKDAGVQDKLNLAAADEGNPRNSRWHFATNLIVSSQNLESTIHAVQRIPSHCPGKPSGLIPIRFILANKLTRDHKLILAFDAMVLSEALGRKVEAGKIIHGNSHSSIKVKISSLTKEVRKRINKIAGEATYFL
jgi:hypothetical protein